MSAKSNKVLLAEDLLCCKLKKGWYVGRVHRCIMTTLFSAPCTLFLIMMYFNIHTGYKARYPFHTHQENSHIQHGPVMPYHSGDMCMKACKWPRLTHSASWIWNNHLIHDQIEHGTWQVFKVTSYLESFEGCLTISSLRVVWTYVTNTSVKMLQFSHLFDHTFCMIPGVRWGDWLIAVNII